MIERLGKQAHATPPGCDLLAAAERIFRECDEAEDVMRRYRDGWLGRVRVGAPTTILINQLSPILWRLRTEHPKINLQVKSSATRDSVASIIRNDMDLAVVSLPIGKSQVNMTPLFSERLVAVFPKDTRVLPNVVTPEFVMTQPLLLEHTRAAVRERVLTWLSAQGATPTIAMELGTVETLLSAVASNLGMSIIPETSFAAQEQRVVMRPLRPALTRTLALIEHHSKQDYEALAVVRNALLTLRHSIGRGGSTSATRLARNRSTVPASAKRPRVT